ncbi:uncharacterized protein BDZ99DRAFT_497204 [Mytilinidion resinicola]|uniref:DNA repair protein RAD16 n=1 Tax=Mytilinidion resinicola TaxID=574789 RepID=A0A6A6YRP4_9PEZI|nr:uncharacterized protein BDZ99DRAFT_497204 [Mytilinidion resinicola]KAF2811441.1 hypothetical protein BDZ99DRAFT_497204 [Mytilinidion resinicola]
MRERERPARKAKLSSATPLSTGKATGTPSTLDARTRASRSSIPNSSDLEDDDSVIEVLPSKPLVRRLLKEVAIPAKKMTPVKGLSGSKGKGKLAVANASAGVETASSTSPVDSASFEDSDNDTPATSLSTTPAVSVRGKARPTRLVPNVAGKRKRSRLAIVDTDDDEAESVDMSADAQLARALQEEEYNAANATASSSKRIKSGYNAYTSTGKPEVSDDDELLEMDLDFLDPPKASGSALASKTKGKAKASVRQSRPSRMASSSARKSLALPSDLESIADSDDEFNLEDESLLSTEPESDGEALETPAPKNEVDPNGLEARLLSIKGRGRTKWKPRRAKKDRAANAQRMSRFAHIEDRWERKRAMNRDRLEEAHPKLTTMWKDLEAIPVLETMQAEQPADINRTLKSFQLEGLSWMIRQEKTHYKGGLLGDEMGMGKTIQAVSLIMSDYPAKSPTLVVVPPVALMQWSNEISAYTNGKLNVLVYHGTNAKSKKATAKQLMKYDVIMVSYNSLESLYRKETKGWARGEDIIKESSPLHAITYHRLILDEAHSIKQRTTGVAKACFALKATYKWCLSGTPVQNRIGEFFSLLRFLEVRPFADYFCRSCDCEQLHWSLDDDHMCVACNHGGSEHVSVFNQELLNPITGDDAELRDEAMDKLHLITSRIMLRRMKNDNTSSMELPPKEVVIHNEFFCDIERDFSSSIMTNSARKFDTYVSQGVMLNNYANIFGLIMQMRQVANHPDLLLKKHAIGGQNVLICNICDEPAEEAIKSRCNHEFCRSCVKSYVQSCEGEGAVADCPRCHIPLTIDFDQPDIEQDEESVKKTSIINRIKMENWTSSTKIEMLVYDLYKLRSKKQTLKSIVFSQFTSMLQLIEWRLRRAGFNTVMLDGSMTPAQRQKSIEYFMNNAEVEVFLVSLKAGGVALNLTEASRVFIVDPWWNPAAEWQSADRCHRIGQKRPCVITRLCIEDSVESRMVLLQEKKAAMISGTINNDKVAMDKLSPEDLQFLFRGT